MVNFMKYNVHGDGTDVIKESFVFTNRERAIEFIQENAKCSAEIGGNGVPNWSTDYELLHKIEKGDYINIRHGDIMTVYHLN